MQIEMDMAPYEEQFTKLERLFYERNAAMNIVAYMSDKNFTIEQYQKVFNDYLKMSKDYDKYLIQFENEVVKPNNEGNIRWTADFERRVVYVTAL